MDFPFEYPLYPAVFKERPNRFLAYLEKEGEIIAAHVPDPGRLKELLLPGVDVLIRHNPGPKRKTDWTLTLVRKDKVWVCINTTLPNRFVLELLHQKKLPEFREYPDVIPESTHGNSRFDFQLRNETATYWLEVKSVSLVSNAVGLFPDAPTVRGTKHLRHLTELVSKDVRSGVLFMVQRSDAIKFSPNWITDPVFSQALKTANESGVEILVYTSMISPQGISLGKKLSFDLDNEYPLPENSHQ